MSNFIKRFIWALINRPFERVVDWTKEDRNLFDNFCRSMTGQKLLELLRQTAATTTFKAVYHPGEQECGRARGMQDLLASIHRLRSFPFEESVPAQGEDVEPLPSQRNRFDGRRFSVGGGNSAIR
jgi:hypothetical protein